jgi:hypothetical protein
LTIPKDFALLARMFQSLAEKGNFIALSVMFAV